MSQDEQMYQITEMIVGYDNEGFNLVIDELFELLNGIDPDQKISAQTSYSGYIGEVTFTVPQSLLYHFYKVTQ